LGAGDSSTASLVGVRLKKVIFAKNVTQSMNQKWRIIMNKKPNLSRYQFAEIPNNQEGRAFIGQLKAYLNKDRYHVVVKGQHMNDEAKANWRRYESGQPIALSTHLRVYVNDSIGN
jgi:hypothetical protein